MYEQKSINNSDVRIFGLKVLERILEEIDVFEREFLDDEEKQSVLESKTTITWKLFGFQIIKFSGCTVHL